MMWLIIAGAWCASTRILRASRAATTALSNHTPGAGPPRIPAAAASARAQVRLRMESPDGARAVTMADAVVGAGGVVPEASPDLLHER